MFHCCGRYTEIVLLLKLVQKSFRPRLVWRILKNLGDRVTEILFAHVLEQLKNITFKTSTTVKDKTS
jgi:hypothetical protein